MRRASQSSPPSPCPPIGLSPIRLRYIECELSRIMFFSPNALIMSSSNGGSFSQAGSGAYPGLASRGVYDRPSHSSLTHFSSDALASARAEVHASLSRSPSLGGRHGHIRGGPAPSMHPAPVEGAPSPRMP